MNKNPVNAILENLTLNETKSINLGSGKSAYSYGGKYYIKSGDTKKEISADQYQKLLNKNNQKSSNKSNQELSNDTKKESVQKRLDTLSNDLGIKPLGSSDFEPTYARSAGEKAFHVSKDDAHKICKKLSKYSPLYPSSSEAHNTVKDDWIQADYIVPKVGVVSVKTYGLAKSPDQRYYAFSVRNLTKSEKKSGLEF